MGAYQAADDGTGRLEDEGEIGARLIALLWDPAWWIKRRIEQITFDDHSTIRRRTYFDISFDDYWGSEPYLPTIGARALLPISLQPRRPSREITVLTADGEPLPHLNRKEERAFLCAGLAVAGDVLATEESRLVPTQVRTARLLELLEPGLSADVVPDDWNERPRLRHRLARFTRAMKPYIDDFAANRLIVAMPETRTLFGDSAQLTEPNRKRLQETHPESVEGGLPAPAIIRWVRSLRVIAGLRQYRWWRALPRPPWIKRLLEAGDPVEVVRTARSVYDSGQAAHAIYWRDRRRHVGERHRDHTPIWRRQVRRDDVYYRFYARELQSTQSYHLEIVCPPGIYVDEAWLVITRPLGIEATNGDSEYAVEVIEIEDDDPHWDAAHFYYFDALPEASWKDPDDEPVRDIEAEVLAVLRPMYDGVMRSGRNTSVLTCLLLGFLTVTIGWIAADLPAVLRVPFSHRDTNSIVSLLLLAPTIALAVLIREDEHLLIKRVVEGYRQRLGVVAGCTAVCAIVLAVGVSGLWLFGTLALSTGVALFATGRTIRSAAYSRDRVATPLEVQGEI